MYPYEIVFGLTLYDILLALSAVAAILIFNFFSNRRKLDARYHNFILFDAIVTLFVGYGSAVLFQGFYNYLENGVFELTETTGATFLGGLLGGAACFLAFYYGIGAMGFKDGLHVKMMYPMLDVFATCVPAAHAIGRLGCLCAGCCHGKATDAWYGIKMVYLGYKVVPVQLFEALFLAVLTVFLFYRALKNKKGNLPIYMCLYGIWRFFAEYMRDDDRGSTVVSFLSPSQLVSLLLIAGAFVVWFILYRKRRSTTQNE